MIIFLFPIPVFQIDRISSFAMHDSNLNVSSWIMGKNTNTTNQGTPTPLEFTMVSPDSIVNSPLEKNFIQK
jgi:hypothetical protein